MWNSFSKFLDWIGNTAADLLTDGSNKDSGVVVGVLAIILTCLFLISVVFGCISWLTGIGFWWLWAIAFGGYLIVVLYMHVMINIRGKRE
jgi:hypothetical protein